MHTIVFEFQKNNYHHNQCFVAQFFYADYSNKMLFKNDACVPLILNVLHACNAYYQIS